VPILRRFSPVQLRNRYDTLVFAKKDRELTDEMQVP
jgi:hypothetical protein